MRKIRFRDDGKNEIKINDINVKKESFWESMQELVNNSEVRIDRPQHSAHPRYPEYIYPFDYGYLDGTVSGDGDGIDIWAGSEGGSKISGVIVIVDPVKKDSEVKILLGCKKDDMEEILECQKRGSMNAILIEK